MISTPEQYDAAKEWIAKFEKKLAYLASKDGKEDPLALKIERDSYVAFIGDLKCEVTEYEAEHQPDLVGAEQR